MKKLFTLILISLSLNSLAIEGEWQVLNGSGTSVHFIKINSSYYSHTQESFVYPNGNLSHTIDQSVKVNLTGDGKVEGTVDFFDSRGCSYRDYEVSGELSSQGTLNLLMTVPRYKLVKITTGDVGRPYERPRYCWRRSPHYPYQSYRYVCGYDSGVSTRTECRLVETVKVPVSLRRNY